MKKVLVSIGLILVGLLSFYAGVFGDDWVDVRKKAEQSIVLIYNSSGTARGTGFFVGEIGEPATYIVTSHHVVTPYEDWQPEYYINSCEGDSDVQVVFSTMNQDRVNGTVVADDPKHDLALIRINPTTKRVPLPLAYPDKIETGASICAFGYPGITESNSASREKIKPVEGIISDIELSHNFSKYEKFDIIWTDAEINAGHSGGPVLNTKGEVVGVNEFIKTDKNGGKMAAAIFVSELINFLKDEHYPYYQLDDFSSDLPYFVPDAPTPSNPGVSVPSIPDDPSSPAAPAPSVPDAPNPTENIVPEETQEVKPVETSTALPEVSPAEEENRILKYVLIGVLAALLLGVLVYLIRPIRTSGNGPSRPDADNWISGLNGPMKSTKFPLSKSSDVRIGRSRNCTIRIPDKTPGVSKEHCLIHYSKTNNCYVVRDLGSTYGTFISRNGSNSKKRVPSDKAVAIRDGDVIYLGSLNVSFKCRLG